MPSGRRKLLLADDSPTIRKVVSLTFGDEGFEVVAVGDGVEALRALAEEPPPDVLLADAVMPGPDGYELCERVKRDGRLARVPVVLLVGAFEPFNEAEARRVGADTVLTKPFQSIRDLVSKVGSLLGGGEARDEDEAARARDADARVAHEPPPEPAARAEARGGAEPFAAEDAREPEPAFADFGADDELIEARPADAFGAAASASGFQTRAERPQTFAEAREPDFHAPRHADLSAAAAPDAPDADVAGAGIFAGRGEADEADEAGLLPEPGLLELTEEMPMRETTSPRPSFDARAEGAAAADDALLDLGLVDAPPPAAAAAAPPAESDDFILDLDDLDLGDEPRAAHATPGVLGEPDAEVLDAPAYAPAPVWADAPSAFAEAAHGEPAAPAHAEAGRPFEMSAAPFEAAAPAAVEDAPWRDIVVQDGPQGFAFGGEEPQALASPASPAPRGFVEPEVVPADEPVPATVEGEFTDGSVEGDVPRPPAGAPSSSAADAGVAGVAGVAPREASAAGFAVGEARSGVEESPRAESLSAGRLSPEEVDAVARRVVELMSDKVVREIAWEVVPELAELLIKRRLDEERRS